MASTLIVYGSSTGNTEYVASVVQRILSESGHEAKTMDAGDAEPEGLCANYDCILFGCSTWGDDEIELQDDFISLFESFDAIQADGKKTAVFGCGDSSYTYFCGAVDAIEQKLQQLGAKLIVDGLKIDGDPHSVKSSIEDWAKQVAAAL